MIWCRSAEICKKKKRKGSNGPSQVLSLPGPINIKIIISHLSSICCSSLIIIITGTITTRLCSALCYSGLIIIIIRNGRVLIGLRNVFRCLGLKIINNWYNYNRPPQRSLVLRPNKNMRITIGLCSTLCCLGLIIIIRKNVRVIVGLCRSLPFRKSLRRPTKH